MQKSADMELSEFKIVNEFPRPFKEACSPYHKRDFNETTRQMCKNYAETSLSKIFKIIILGDVSVGKTCIVNRFSHQIFNSNYKATIGVDFEVEIFTVLGVSFTLQIWDTAGQERFKCIAQSYYRGAHAIMVVFDMSSIMSLSHCETWLQEALHAGNTSESLIFLVGNKKDLLSPAAYRNMEDLSAQTAKKLNAEYWSVSAKSGDNIKELFFRIAALTFDTSMLKQKDVIRSNKIVPVGTDLVAFRKKTENKKGIPKCSSCN